MDNYKEITFKYMWKHKLRTINTFLGMIVSTILIYTVLTLAIGAFVTFRDEQRQIKNYDLIVFAKDKDDATSIMDKLKDDRRVTDTYAGSVRDCYWYDQFIRESGDAESKSVVTNQSYSLDDKEETEDIYKVALYITVRNPYRSYSILEGLNEDYNLEGILNVDLADYYFNGEDGSAPKAIAAILLLICYVIGMFAASIMKNTLMLSMVDRNKDYGLLRCIGCSVKQLRKIVICEAIVIGIPALLSGIILGTITSLLCGRGMFPTIKIDVYPLAIIVTGIVIFGSLYFAMIEPCKMFKKSTPIDNLQNNNAFAKGKLKVRRKSIFGVIFGIEGNYANKSLRRNSKRFVQMIFSFSIFLVMAIVFVVFVRTENEGMRQMKDMYSLYQINITNVVKPYLDSKFIKEGIPTEVQMSRIVNNKDVESVKKRYITDIYATEYLRDPSMYSDEYISMLEQPRFKVFLSEYNANKDSKAKFYSGMPIEGYDDDDMEKLKDYVVEGSLDLGDDGIALVNYGYVSNANYEGVGMMPMDCIKLTKYKIGDNINFLDPDELRKAFNNEMESRIEDYSIDKNLEEYSDDYFREINESFIAARKYVISKNCYKTYKVKAILKDDIVYNDESTFVVPLDTYYKLTGTDEDDYYGYSIRVTDDSNRNYSDLSRILYEITPNDNAGYTYYDDRYIQDVGFINTLNYQIAIAMIVVGFIAGMGLINVINTSISNIGIRANELAMLRILGMSKRRLIYMCGLEGVITALYSVIIGIPSGILISYYIYYIEFMFIGVGKYSIPIAAIIGLIILLTVVMAAANIVPIALMNKNITDNLSCDE